MIGALVAKAAAYSVRSDPDKYRHVMDFAVLAAIVRATDSISAQLTLRDRHYLDLMLVALDRPPRTWMSIEGAERGVLGLKSAMA